MEEHDGVMAAPKKNGDVELKLLSVIDPSIAEQLVEQSWADGVDLVDPDGLLGKLTK